MQFPITTVEKVFNSNSCELYKTIKGKDLNWGLPWHRVLVSNTKDERGRALTNQLMVYDDKHPELNEQIEDLVRTYIGVPEIDENK